MFSSSLLMIILFSILLFFSIIIKIKNKQFRMDYNIYDGKIIYSDLKESNKPLFSSKYHISGKPDYILKKRRNRYIPIEVKTGIHEKPKIEHIMQLISYCQLVEETYKQKCPYGILIYYDTKKQFKIPYSNQYKSLLKNTIKTMREQLQTKEIERNHQDVNKCKHCSMKTYCHENIKAK